MARSILISGNGIGLALDPTYFSLREGLHKVWNNAEYLSKEYKDLILSAIEGTSAENPPESEGQLDQLQVAIIATEYLSDFSVGGVSWVSDGAKKLPSTFKKYIHEVAHYFHRSNKVLPDNFLIPLSDFIKKSKSHVVTLNYDNLLYDGFRKTKVFDGYNGSLVDGFWRRTGFLDDNLNRNNTERLGWYMHLHGSPLFIGNNKITGIGRDFLQADEECHIVLTHVEHKPLIISSSKILSTYWRRLEKAFEESSRIILFGYSGCDDHLNERIKLRKKDKSLLIIEWSEAGSEADRKKFWQSKTNFDNFELVRLDNILNYTEW